MSDQKKGKDRLITYNDLFLHTAVLLGINAIVLVVNLVMAASIEYDALSSRDINFVRDTIVRDIEDVRADIKTDIAELQEYVRERRAQLIERNLDGPVSEALENQQEIP